MADETEVASVAGAGRYATKYLSKDMSRNVWPKGFRRVRTSRRWPKPPELPEAENWYFEVITQRETLADAERDYRNMGWEVVRTDHLTAWDIVNALN